MSEHNEILHNVFQPGNLAWGSSSVHFEDLESFSQTGLLPGYYLNKYFSIRPNNVCMSMLNRHNDEHLTNYRDAMHKGPKGNESWHRNSLTLILSRAKLLEKYSDRLVAIGEFFHGKGVLPDFDFNLEEGTVYGVKIGYKEPYSEEPWLDEVVVNFPRKRTEDKGLTPDLWVGAISLEAEVDKFRDYFNRLNLQHMPIISSTGKLIK